MKTFILLVLVVIIAWLTVPQPETFKPFLIKKGRDISACRDSSTSITTYPVFSIAYINYCENGNTITRTDKYLGLFGTYWRLSN